MLGIVTTFKFKQPLTQEQIETIKDTAIKPMTEEPGFRDYYALSGESTQVVSLHTWDSKEQAEAALSNMAPRLQGLIQDILLEPPIRFMSEVVAEFHA